MGEIGLEIDKKGNWCLLGSLYGAAPIPRSTAGPRPHSLSPVPKLGIPMYPLVGLIFTTSVLDSHPALTNTARMRELICCAPVISLLAALLKYALFCAVRPRCRARADRMDARTFAVLTSSPCSPVHPGSPDIRVTGRLYMKNEIPMVENDQSVRTQLPLSLV